MERKGFIYQQNRDLFADSLDETINTVLIKWDYDLVKALEHFDKI